jgi:hypothetical protein
MLAAVRLMLQVNGLVVGPRSPTPSALRDSDTSTLILPLHPSPARVRLLALHRPILACLFVRHLRYALAVVGRDLFLPCVRFAAHDARFHQTRQSRAP